VTDEIGRNGLAKVGFSQGVLDRSPECRLTNPGDGRVNRHQSIGQWRPLVIRSNGRMDHFETKEPATNQSVGQNRSPWK
jgi:hypothetical protein